MQGYKHGVYMEKREALTAPVIPYFNGYRIHTTDALVFYVQRRVHRKKRINKKWRKRYGKYTVPDTRIIMAGDILYMHPDVYRHLQPMLEKLGGVRSGI